MQNPAKIVALSDTSLGLGSPQIEWFVESLADLYETPHCWILEPDVKGKRALHESSRVNVKRFGTRMGPHGHIYHLDYNVQLISWLENYKADIVVVTSGMVLPALLSLKTKPRKVIYYMLENLEYQRTLNDGELIKFNQMARSLVDLICVPELGRAQFDLDWLGWHDIPVVEILNVSRTAKIRDSVPRDFRILHAGSICENTNSHFLVDGELSDFPVDVFGIFSSVKIKEAFDRLSAVNSSVAYRGVLPLSQIDQILPNYAYSLTMWRPVNINQIYASPNKFFQCIGHGVPAIAAPHPQCSRIIQRYNCGILMDDWSKGALVDALIRARDLFGTAHYQEMIRNCAVACAVELNWSAQFAKINEYL